LKQGLEFDIQVPIKNPRDGRVPTVKDRRSVITSSKLHYLDAIQHLPLDTAAPTVSIIVVDHRNFPTRQLTVDFQRVANSIPKGFVWIADRNGRPRCHTIVPLIEDGDLNGEAGDGNGSV
jgi:hypothetical protein